MYWWLDPFFSLEFCGLLRSFLRFLERSLAFVTYADAACCWSHHFGCNLSKMILMIVTFPLYCCLSPLESFQPLLYPSRLKHLGINQISSELYKFASDLVDRCTVGLFEFSTYESFTMIMWIIEGHDWCKLGQHRCIQMLRDHRERESERGFQGLVPKRR